MKSFKILVIVLVSFTVTQAQWTIQNNTTLYDCHLLQNGKGLVVGGGGIVYQTTNFGDNWFTSESLTNNTLFSVRYLDENTALACGLGGVVLKSTDAGVSWTQKQSNTSNDLSEIYFLNQSLGWIIYGNEGGYLKTTYAGETWQIGQTGVNWWLKSIQFLNETVGFCGGDGPTLLKTTDGGNSWFSCTGIIGGGLVVKSVYFVNNNLGWACGGDYGS